MKQEKNATEKKANLFSAAKKVEPTKEAKGKLPSLPTTPEIDQHLKEYADAKSESKNLEAKLKISEGVIKEYARGAFLIEYKKQGRNIGSFKLGDITVSIQDRYAKMDENLAQVVSEKFPAVIEKTTEYLLNQEILSKYIEEISDALQSANGIPESDLALLIEAKEVSTVKKGTIDTLATFGDEMGDLFEAIAPIISMR